MPLWARFGLDALEYDADKSELGIRGCEDAEEEVAAGRDDELVPCRFKNHLFKRPCIHLFCDPDARPHEVLGRCGDLLEISIPDRLDRKAFKKRGDRDDPRQAQDLLELALIKLGSGNGWFLRGPVRRFARRS